MSGGARAERRARGGGDGRSDVQAGGRTEALSSRELGVLEELAMGTSTEDIAGKFHVSPHTVRTHIKNILRKLDAHTRAHAVAIAYSEDAIDPDVSTD
ncbi:MAG TPA: helix-turn-helix transcriptional regulator [Thermoleophilaceae bacterium]|jgi:DNA-binding NarL/FixJ family response regulator